MKYTAAGLAVVAGAASALAQSAPIVTSPASLVTCLPASITASGGTGPYYISILPGGQPTATPLENLGETSGQLTWKVNLAAGTSVTIQVRDQTGTLNYSAQTTIQAGSDTSCVGQSAAISGATSAASTPAASSTVASSAASSAAVTTSSAAVSSAAASVTSRASSAISAASSSAAAAASSARTGAATIVRPAAGALALVGAAAYLLL